MRGMKKTSSGMFICSFPECQAAYDKEWKLEAHLCKHTGVRPFKCAYAGCSKAFCTKSHLARHELTHTGEKPFSCSEDGCTQTFTTNFNLRKHISRKHKQEVKLYTCSFEGCGRSFKKNNLLKTHESAHTLQLPYKCTYEGCDRCFVNPSKRKRHEKVHRGYTCPGEDCSFVAKNWTELTKHRKEHKVRVQCDKCNKTFKDRWYLKQHSHVHSEARLVFLCPRDGCRRSYTTAFNLQSHILSFHEQQRAFSCTHPGCTKSFSMKQSLQRHSVVHDPERKKQKTPRLPRSLASRLSGYKTPKKRQTEPQSPTPVSGQSDSSQAVISSEPVQESVTDMSDGTEILQSDLVMSESSVVLILEPLVLETPTDSQSDNSQTVISSEPVQDEVTDLSMSDAAEIFQSDLEMSESSVLVPLVIETRTDGQSEINRPHNIPETIQSEFLNIVTVQAEFNKSFDREVESIKSCVSDRVCDDLTTSSQTRRLCQSLDHN